MRGIKQYHAQIRKREAEHQKIERMESDHKYFDQWGRITSKYESWTTPEYYQQSSAAVALTKQREQRLANVDERRERLRVQLDAEEQALQLELSERSRPRSRPTSVSTDTLRNINSALRRTADEKRRCDLESQLYTRWRHAAREDAILHDSKSDHEALAKLNWLDRQVAAQVERDAEQRADEERRLQLHEESRRHMECLAQRRVQRNVELDELKRRQDAHMAELKLCTADSERLRAGELLLRQRLAAVGEERTRTGVKQDQRRGRFAKAESTSRRVKLLLRQRSDAVCAALRDDCDQLDRLKAQATAADGAEQLAALRAGFEWAVGAERRAQESVEAMYESEAKHLLVAREREWAEQDAERLAAVRRLCDGMYERLQQELSESVRRQRDMIAIRESHIRTVQQTNERLKELMADQRSDELSGDDDLRTMASALEAAAGRSTMSAVGGKAVRSPQESSRSSGSGADRRDDCSIVESLRSSSLGSELSAPRFGRKKIAWT